MITYDFNKENYLSENDYTEQKIPIVFIRRYETIISKGSSITIPYYVSDYDNTDYMQNKIDKVFTTIITINNRQYKKTTYAGEHSITLDNQFTLGRNFFSIKAIDENGVASIEQFFEFLVVDTIYTDIPQYETYIMDEADLENYNIYMGETEDAEIGKKNKVGLSKLFASVKELGFNKILMLKRTLYA